MRLCPCAPESSPAKTKFPELVFSGMQPTHALHRGNYGLVICQEAACRQRLGLAGRVAK